MLDLFTGFSITLVSLLIGYKLGKDQTLVTDTTKKQIQKIFSRVVPRSDVGAVVRPTAQDNYYRDNPQARTEDAVMTETIDTLTQQ